MAKEKIVKIRSITELFKDSWYLFSRIWKEYLVYYLLVILGFFALMAVSFGYPLAKLIIENPNTKDITPEMVMANWPFLVLGLVLFIVFAAFMSLALAKLVYTRAGNKEIALKDAFRYSGQNLFSYIGVSLAVGILIILGFVLLILPGIYAFTVLLFVPVIFVVEEVHSLDALKRSQELVRGNFWAVLGRFLVLMVVLSLLSEIFKNAPLVQTIINFITGAISLGYVYYMYKDLTKK